MKKRKIVVIGPAFPYRGGNSLFVSHLYDVLKNNFNVKIFNFKLLYPSFLFPGTTQYDKSGVVIKKAPNERVLNSINPVNWFTTANKLIAENADLVIFDWWHPFFGICYFSVSQLIKKKYGGKILFITENVVSHEGNFIDRFLTKIGLKNAGAFLTLSADVKNDLSAVSGGRKIYKSELPVYDCYGNSADKNKITREKLNIPAEAKLLLFFGYVRKYKGLDILLDAFAELIQSDSAYRLLIVGEFYDDPKEYFRLIDELKISDFVTVVNKFVPNETVAEYYEISDVVVLPYRSATQSGILNVAYGTGTPVIVTDVGGLREFVDEARTGLVASAPDAELIKRKISEFFELRESVDFKSNISAKIKTNEFFKLPELIDNIIEDLNES